MIPTFQNDPRREATPAIRGYVYQVDRSVECWLFLEEGVELQLECGEDIDHVAKAVAQSRVVEQVKHDAGGITLCSSNAAGAVANFLNHRKANPDADLRFRYLTNAPVGKEKAESVKTEGIVLWRQVQEDTLTPEDNTAALRDIRKLLTRASRPHGYNKKNWETAQAFWTTPSDERLLDLIRRFEWINDAPSAASMQSRLRLLLIELSHAPDDTSAGELYYRLFVHVIKLLATDGPKVLTRDGLRQVLERPLSDHDRRLLESIVFRLVALEDEMSCVQEWRRDMTAWHDQQEAFTVSVRARVFGVVGASTTAEFSTTISAPSLDVPEPVERLSMRRAGVQTVMDALIGCHWLALEGVVSCGKTHLAILTARHVQTNDSDTTPQVLWLSLRDLTPQDALAQLDAACASVAGPPPTLNRQAWLDRFCQGCGAGSLMVLDDLPHSKGFDALTTRLVELARAAERGGMKLFSTSHHALSPEVEERLSVAVRRLPCPQLDDQEAHEILLAHGAPPERFATPRTRFINLHVKGHPLLLAAFARYLSDRGWRLGDQEIEALFSSEFASELNERTLNRLLQSAGEGERELLYRLNTRGGAFSTDEARLLANVSPSLAHPGEKLAALTGLWVQRETGTLFRVSPLIQVLGEEELAADTRHGCHRALAHHVLERKKLDQFDLSEVVRHFAGAKDWEEAGSFLAYALGEVWAQDHASRPSNDAGLTLCWGQKPLPLEMSLGLRLVIRAHHVGFAGRWGEEMTFVAHDLMALLSQATPEEGWAMVGVLLVAAEALADYDFALHCRLLGDALRYAAEPLQLPNGTPLEVPADHPLESFLWTSVIYIRSTADLSAWLQAVEALPAEGRRRALADDLAPTSCLEAANRLWRMELDKPESARDWNALAAIMGEAAERALHAGMPLLGAAFTHTLVTIRGEYQRDFEAAQLATQHTLSLVGDDEDAAFLAESSLGRAFGVAVRYDEAATWLERAANRGGTRFSVQRMQALVCLSKAVADGSRANKVAAVETARRAVELAEAAPDVPQHEQARAWGELGIARWLADDLGGAFESMEAAARCLLENRSDSEFWKDAFVVLGHVLGYLTSQAIMGHRPAGTMDGSEYLPPHRTMFIGFHEARASLYRPERDVFLSVQLSSFAQGVGRDDRALEWALPALEAARRAGQQAAVALLAFRVVPHHVENLRFDEAFSSAREQASLIVNAQETQPDGNIFNLAAFLSLQPVEAAQLDESRLLIIETWVAAAVLMPAAFTLAIISIHNRQAAALHARRLIELCQEQFNLSQYSFWQEAGYIIERGHLSRPSYQWLLHYPIRSSSDDLDDLLRILCYLGATLQSDVTLSTALQLHLAFLPALDRRFLGSDRTSYRRIVVPFFFTYWLDALRFRRSEFTSKYPLPVGATLEAGALDAATQPPEQGIKQLMMVMSVGLDVGGTKESQIWLTE